MDRWLLKKAAQVSIKSMFVSDPLAGGGDDTAGVLHVSLPSVTSQERARDDTSFSVIRLGRMASVEGSLSIVPNSPATLLLYHPVDSFRINNE